MQVSSRNSIDSMDLANIRIALGILVTHPKHQRRGAGGMLVRWGCKKADERGVISILQAAEAGLQLYLKHGFEIVKETPMDLRPYGVDETEIRRHMIRQPRKEVVS
jgi:predicted N-acetyltransferase YhbS